MVVVDGRRAAVNVTIQIPAELETGLRELMELDPEFLNRVILYGVTRRSLCDHIRQRKAVATSAAQIENQTARMPKEVTWGPRSRGHAWWGPPRPSRRIL